MQGSKWAEQQQHMGELLAMETEVTEFSPRAVQA
jgi:hypothetical protein